MFGNVIILFTGFITILASARENRGSLINSLKKSQFKASVSDSGSAESSDETGFIEQLKHMDLDSLIKLANHLKAKSDSKKTSYRHKLQNIENINVPAKHSNRYLFKNQIKQERKPWNKVVHKRLTPNTLLGSAQQHDDRRVKTGALGDYSKIYVILDPESLKSRTNQEAVTNLLSRLLGESANDREKTNRHNSKAFQYKGFQLKDNIRFRRYRRDSKEMYGGGGGGGSMEDRPKRQRGGGGGGGSGRTAIPYIRQRGDIYERDH